MNGLTRAQHALFSGTRQDDDSGAGDGQRLLDRFNDAKRAEERERVKHQGDNDATK